MSQLKELINSTDIVEVNGEVGISMPDKKFRLTPEETKIFLAHLKQLMDEVEFIEGKEWINTYHFRTIQTIKILKIF